MLGFILGFILGPICGPTKLGFIFGSIFGGPRVFVNLGLAVLPGQCGGLAERVCLLAVDRSVGRSGRSVGRSVGRSRLVGRSVAVGRSTAWSVLKFPSEICFSRGACSHFG